MKAVSKVVEFGILAAPIAALYVAIALGLGALLGIDGQNTVLSLAATAVVALAFQPARNRVRRFANRLVYGRRSTPYEVMAGFAHRVSDTLSVDDVLPEMAEAAARGVGATRARVRLLLPDGGERSVSWPDDATAGNGAVSSDGPPVSVDVDVAHRGVPIGRISIEKRAGNPVTPGERKLLVDLASQAGLAMHNVRLTEELARRLDELAHQSQALQVSRQRLVTARDVQRRGLERDIREGPQRHLVEIGKQLRDAAACADRDPPRAEQILDRLGQEATTTLEILRDLARGIFPPLLAEKGVLAAIQAHIRKVGANATVEAPTVGSDRFDADTEAALYFICLQALQNVSRHAGNAPTIVRLARDGDELLLEIEDRGPGFDASSTPRGMGMQIMQDRVDALDGSLDVGRARDGGALVSCRLHVRVAEVSPA
jgi:signal transduction histidine kinase